MLPSKIKKTGFPRVLSNLRCFKQNISSSSKLLSGHTHKKSHFQDKNNFLESLQALLLPNSELCSRENRVPLAHLLKLEELCLWYGEGGGM